MYKFLGLCLLQAQIKVPRIRHIFSKKSLYYHPIFPSTMSGRRFEQLLRCLNVNPNSGETHMRKMDSFLKIFKANCQAAYKPGPNLSHDESLLLFKGRLSFRQYFKNRSSKYGIKFYKYNFQNISRRICSEFRNIFWKTWRWSQYFQNWGNNFMTDGSIFWKRAPSFHGQLL